MRILVFFDLPVTTSRDKREYLRFRKFLIKSGFLMMQQSVYSKLTLNFTVAEAIISNVYQCRPPSGLVQLLVVTEKQFSRMEFIVGENSSNVIQTDARLVIL